jgi:hypothetical protein
MSRAFAALVRVELREVMPLWLGAVLVIAVTSGGPFPMLRAIGVAAWVGAQVALAAMFFGHDFRHRTLDALLVQPISRGALLTIKLAVLVPLLAGLAAAMWLTTDNPSARFGGAWFLLPTVCALCLAPWLTLVTRSELAGMVFAGGVPTMLWIGAQVAALATYGFSFDRAPQVDELQSRLFAPAFALTLVAGAIGTVVTFLRLEAPGAGASGALNWLSFSSRHTAPRRLNRYRTLVLKEIRLQRLALVVAGLFTLAWIALAKAPISVGDRADVGALQVALLVLYVGTMLFLVASVTSAEERQLGVLPAQVLQPISMARQWAVKLATAAAVALLLVVALPWSLDAMGFGLTSESGGFGGRLDLEVWFAAGSAFVVGVYVSSLSRRGLTALLGAFFAMGCLTMLVGRFGYDGMLFRYWLGQQIYELSWLPTWDPREHWWLYRGTIELLEIGIGLVLAAVTLRYAMRNHGTLEQPARVMPRQLAVLALTLLLGLAVHTTLEATIDASVAKAMDKMRQSQSARPPR